MPQVGGPSSSTFALRAWRPRAFAYRKNEEKDKTLDRAESALGNLNAEALIPSAFGYNETQLRFHQGNTLTLLRDTDGAGVAHEAALTLYPHDDYLDRALVMIDHVQCLVHQHDTAGATAKAVQVMSALSPAQTRGLLQSRGMDVFTSLPAPEQQSRAGRELHDLLLGARRDRC